MIIFCDGFDWESYLGLHLSELIYNKKKKKYHISLNVLLDMKIKSIKKSLYFICGMDVPTLLL